MSTASAARKTAAKPPRPVRDQGVPASRPTAGDETVLPVRTARTLPVRLAVGMLLILVTLLLTLVVLTPIALSSQDLIAWARSPAGLHLRDPWPVFVFCSLDAAAGTCVLFSVYCAWRGEPAGTFRTLVWGFAVCSAFANWRHGNAAGAPPDAAWFFPTMSLAGPALLETVLGRVRQWAQREQGRRHRPVPVFGWRRWVPGLGAFRDTFGAYRTALLLDLATVAAAVSHYHCLCPDGSLHVAAAVRRQHVSAAANQQADRPVDLLRRIPVQDDRYQKWRNIWADLRSDPTDRAVLQKTARLHGCSLRQLDFVRRAGASGLLDDPTPPAARVTVRTQQR